MPRGGKRQAGEGKRMGRPPKPKFAPVRDAGHAANLIAALEQPPQENESRDVATWREIWEGPNLRLRLDARKYLYDKRDGRAVRRINHIHDKPIQMTVDTSLATRVEKARQRLAALRHSSAG